VPGKLTSSAGAVIADALERARAEGTSRIAEEHLFAALLANPGSRPLFGRLGGPDEAEAVWAEVRGARRRGGLTASEQEALADLGIDLDEVVARVEAQLGEGALDGTRTSARRGRRASLSPERTFRGRMTVLSQCDHMDLYRYGCSAGFCCACIAR
jgi:hypothetical protein